MPRNKREANKRAFSRLYALGDPSTEALAAREVGRWIKTTPAERIWLEHAEFVNTEAISPRLKFVSLLHDNRHYLLVLGGGFPPRFEDTLIPTSVNAGLLTAVLSEQPPPLRADTSWLTVQENILALSDTVNGYDGHDMNVVLSLFDPIHLYEIDPNAPFDCSALQRAACFWSISSEQLLLPFGEGTKQLFLRVILEGERSIPFGNVLNALFSGHWPHSFLELYRCIEALYGIPALEALHRELNLAIPLLDFIAKFETHLSWWAKEDEALARLCLLCEESTSARINRCLPLTGDEKAAGWLYKLRNSVVHYRPATQRANLNPEQWDKVIEATLLLVNSSYTKFKDHLNR